MRTLVVIRYQYVPMVLLTRLASSMDSAVNKMSSCLLRLECIHGILTPRARSIPPAFSRMGVRVALLTVTTTCDFGKGWSHETDNRK